MSDDAGYIEYDNVCVDCIGYECEIHEAKIVGEELYNRVVNAQKEYENRNYSGNTILPFIEEQNT